MRKLIPFLFLAVLAGCSGGGISGSDKSTIENLLKTPNSKATADSMTFSDWGSETVKEGDKTWTIVRVKETHKPDGKGDPITKDILIRYSGSPMMPLNYIDNKAGDDWKKDVKTLTWPKNEF